MVIPRTNGASSGKRVLCGFGGVCNLLASTTYLSTEKIHCAQQNYQSMSTVSYLNLKLFIPVTDDIRLAAVSGWYVRAL